MPAPTTTTSASAILAELGKLRKRGGRRPVRRRAAVRCRHVTIPWSAQDSLALRADPGSAIFRCCSARTPAGVTLAIADCSLFFQPLTTSPSPRIMASNPTRATSAGSSFFDLPDLRVQHVRALEEVRLGGPRHQARHRDAGIFQLGTQRKGERIDECFGAVVDGLIGARHEAGDRAGQQDATLAPAAHRPADQLHQIDRARDVRVDDVAHVLEVLIEKAVSQPMARIGEQRIDGPACRRGPQLIHARGRRQVCFDDGDVRAETAEAVGGGLNLRAIGGDQQIESLLRTDRGQFESDARRGPVTIANGLLIDLPRPACPRAPPARESLPGRSARRASRHRRATRVGRTSR